MKSKELVYGEDNKVEDSELKRHIKSLLISKLLVYKNDYFLLSENKVKSRLLKVKTVASSKKSEMDEQESELEQEVRKG